MVDRLEGSEIHNLKELRPGSAGRTEVRILFVFDPWRSAILLLGGDKSGDWSGWYRQAIPRAEELYADYVKERESEEGREL
ncbi:type II toxin-antitoxin system RelE/ParE family toxin [Actinomadura sp. 6K520]|uniref:type II toxin-antitoxin system RelE/ParE family toxin n=1 Tax=Actinomadura sp. 6K520 TaxID=2530364 RepID=UPI0026D5D0BA